ncbi:MAG: glycosyltransferase family 39 protein [Chitinophagaceae bacterium]
MNDSYRIDEKWLYWLFGLTTFLLFFRLGAAPIYILDEAKNAECAREMFLRHDWVVPTFNGELRTDKPALHYWFMILSYKVFGVSAFSARFFSVLMGIGTLYLTWFFTARWVNNGTAFFATLVLALSAQFLFEFRLSVPDPYLIFFTTAGLCCGYTYLQSKSWVWIIATAITLALATLAKGPVALALPGLAILLFLVLSRRWKELFDIKFLAAAIIYVVIAAPWYYSVHKATNGAFTRGFFFEHNLSRFSSEMEGHGGPFIITPLIVLLGLLPLGAFVFSVFKKQTGLWAQPFARFSLLVGAVYIAFFSISSTKLPNYPMPCYPFVAILVGFLLNKLMVKRRLLPVYGFIILLVIGLALPVGGWLALRNEVETNSLAMYAWCLSFLPAAIIWMLVNRKRWKTRRMVLTIAFTYFGFNFLFITLLYPMVYQQNPVSKINTITGNGKNTVVAYQDFNPAFLFNSSVANFKVIVFQSPDSLKMHLAANPNPNGERYIITKKDRLASIDTAFYEIVASHHDLFENPTSVLLKLK